MAGSSSSGSQDTTSKIGFSSMLSRLLSEPLPSDFPNRLLEPHPDRAARPRAAMVLLALFALCVAARLPVAMQLHSVCPDGVLYIDMAKAIEQGGLTAGVRQFFGFNTLPVILAAFHRIGFDWNTAGRVWGVLASSLAVLPLFGWARRQYDDRVAIAAGILYATHSPLIRWSPEVMREATFWLLLTLSLYLLWRAVQEARPGLYVLAAASIGLSVLTRFEGLFLLLPATVWTYCRFRALQSGRKRLALGVAVCIVGCVAAWLILERLAPADGSLAIWRTTPWDIVRQWIHARLNPDAISTTGTVYSALPPGLSPKLLIRELIPMMARGLSPVFGVFLVASLWYWRGVIFRSDNLPLVVGNVAIVGGMALIMWYVHACSPRYMLTVAIIACPSTTLAFLSLSQWLASHARQWGLGGAAQRSLAAVPVGAAVAAGLIGVWTCDTSSRWAEWQLAQWVRQHCGPAPVVVGPAGLPTVISHHVGTGRSQPFAPDSNDQLILDTVQAAQPDVVVLGFTKRLTPDRFPGLAEGMKRFGLEPVPEKDLPESCAALRVLYRPKPK